MKKILSIALAVLVSVIMVHMAYSQETQETEVKQVAQETGAEETPPSEVYTFPTIKPEASLFFRLQMGRLQRISKG